MSVNRKYFVGLSTYLYYSCKCESIRRRSQSDFVFTNLNYFSITILCNQALPKAQSVTKKIHNEKIQILLVVIISAYISFY